ncbi:ASB_collapsed_G0036410.mRNA.1.CDS.1 [Saccharomyces cerevisiae]|nr:ASB_HP1_G0035710.mRNA.1.CDS.1 [Saccharomyces cerevisiae]CAI7232803.1 ASB_collapsed_G0036410.mRNA.1.CDS.1 [Saccharomyces cerevisiae]
MTTTIGSPQMLANEERLSNEMHALKNRSEQNGQEQQGPVKNTQLHSPSATVPETTATQKESLEMVPKDTSAATMTSAPPPALPHVEINQVSLALVIRNLTVFTMKELAQYMKTNVHTQANEPNSAKKIRFLQLIIFLRTQFLKLYVLVKWTRTIKQNNFHVLIDLLNWFRTTNMNVNNCIWALKSSLNSMTNAKLPNVDLVTALEVLSLGRPNLPTHNFKLSGVSNSMDMVDGMAKVPIGLILQRLKDLNLTVSIKIALMNIPKPLNSYHIKNGRIYFTVPNEFEIQLSTVNRQSPLFFVDLKLLFNTEAEQTVSAVTEATSTNGDSENNEENSSSNGNNLPLNKPRLEKLINEILLKSNDPLLSLYNFLHKYVLTLQLYMVHREFLKLANGGKFSKSNLIHNYDSKKSTITVRYWLNGKMDSKGKITIGIQRTTESLILKWDNQSASRAKNMPVIYNNIVSNIEGILDEIMFNHARIIRSELLARDIFQEDEENSDVLLFQLPTTCVSMAPIQLKIDLLSGQFYFRNPTPLLSNYASKINRAEGPEELARILQQLKLDKIIHVLTTMFENTGWSCSRIIKIDKPIRTQVNTGGESIVKKEDNKYAIAGNNTTNSDVSLLLQRDLFIRLPHWPLNWYLILSIISSKTSCVVEKRIGKIVSQRGKWHLKYLDNSNVMTVKLESITYQKIMILQRTILNRIINHMLIDSLNQLEIRNKICSSEMINEQKLPQYIIQGSNTNDNISIIALELESFLEGSKALNSILESSMFLRIDYSNSQIRLYAKFKRNTMMIQCQIDKLYIHFVQEEPLAFYLEESFTNLGIIVQYLTKFRQKLMQLVVLTDVVERLHKNFESENFKIIALQPNEISFKYLSNNDEDDKDCTIKISTNDDSIKNLTVQLSPSNPQHIIQPFLDNSKMDYHFIFSYLQFTSSLFKALKVILNERGGKFHESGSQYSTMVNIGLHNLNEYQIVYYNPQAGTKITICIELKTVLHNGGDKIQFHIHFADVAHITTKSPAYPMMHQVRNQVFMLDTKRLGTPESVKPANASHAIRLGNGVACDPSEIEPILMEIHNILKVDSNSSSS